MYVAERCKAVYVQVFKAACTTMLWTLLELEGHDPHALDGSLRGDIPTHDLLVHDRSVYPIPVITEVSSSLRAEALTSDEWLRFAVVRNPYARVYSAWESKLLLGDPGPWQELGGPAPIMVGSSLDVGASFRAFIGEFAANPRTWKAEPHFATQVSLLALDEIDYDELVPTSRLSGLITTLSLRAHAEVTTPTANQGLGVPWNGLLDAATIDRIDELYAEDFERLEYDHVRAGDLQRVLLDPVALRLRSAAVERSARTVELARAFGEKPAPARGAPWSDRPERPGRSRRWGR